MTKPKINVTYKNVKPIIEALKQGGRIFVASTIGLLIIQLKTNSFDLQSILLTGSIAVLMAIDKYVHLEGKLTNNKLLTGGLTRF